MEEQTIELVEQYQNLHKRTRAMSDTQCQYLILRFCTCQNLNHWLRTVRPDLMATAAELYDVETMATLQHLLWADQGGYETDLTDLQMKQVRQHCKLGGLGLTSAVMTSPAAWLGSWTLTKNLIKDRFKNTNYADILDTIDADPYDSLTVRSIKETYNTIATSFRNVGKLNMPLLTELETVTEHAQRFYADALLKELQHDLLQAAPHADRARIRSCAGPKSSAWLNCIPRIALFKLNPTDFRCCVRLRLGLPQLAVRTDVPCKCGSLPDALGVHYLTCSSGNHLKNRHELVVKGFHDRDGAGHRQTLADHPAGGAPSRLPQLQRRPTCAGPCTT